VRSVGADDRLGLERKPYKIGEMPAEAMIARSCRAVRGRREFLQQRRQGITGGKRLAWGSGRRDHDGSTFHVDR